MPDVIVFCRERGQPRARTQSPGRSLDDDPNFTAGKGVLDLIFSKAISECKSTLTTVPSNSRPSCKVTLICCDYQKQKHNLGMTNRQQNPQFWTMLLLF